MYARLVRFSCAPGDNAPAQAVANTLAPLINEQQGCQQVTVFGDDADGEYGLFVLWDSQANADAASMVISPQLKEHLAGHVKQPPDARLFTVIG